MVFLQLFLNGLQLGAIYALTAVGFSLIFGSTKIFHVAHGSAFAISGYIYWWLASKLNVPWPLATLAAVIAAAVFGLFMGGFIYRPIQRHEASFFTVFIAAFGVSLVIQNLIGTVFGRGMETVTTPLSRSVEIMDGLFVAPISAISIGVAILVFVALSYFLDRTHVGIAMRALSQNPDLVRVFGLDPGRVAQWAFVIGSAVVVPGAIFTAMTAGLNPAIGTHVMLVSLAATIVGGIGSVRGAAAGGMLLGLAENLAYWKLDPQWSEAVTFVVLFAFIIFRPSGFFGSPTTAKCRAHVHLHRQPRDIDRHQRDPRCDAQLHPRLCGHLLARARDLLRHRRLHGGGGGDEVRRRLCGRNRGRHGAQRRHFARVGAAGAARARRILRRRLARPADACADRVLGVEVRHWRHRRAHRHSARAAVRLRP